MGTEVQSKMYLPGYYSVQKLSSNVGHGSWSLLHENKNLKNGQQYELFLTRPIMDGFHGRDKEQMRQTILKHESVFRHQLNELHRLYKRQKDLMNEIKSKELLKHQKVAGTSLSSSGFPNEDDRNSRHNSNLPFVDSSFGRPCTSSTGISQSPFNIPIHQKVSIFEVQSGGMDKIGFIKKDIYNLECSVNGKLRNHDVELVTEYFMAEQKKNEGFYFKIEGDGHDRFSRCFWADATSRRAYGFYVDVVVFDTTFNTNRYDLTFAPMLGVNNHGQTIVLACAFLSNETTESFVWMFEEFKKAMPGGEPKTIITDQDAAMAIAISIAFPTTFHRLCIWHITSKFSVKLPRDAYNEYWREFQKAIWDTDNKDEFDAKWNIVVTKAGLTDHPWLSSMFDLKESWVPAYTRQFFAAGMSSSQRAEGSHGFFKQYISRRNSLMDFIIRFERALSHQREKELVADHVDAFEVAQCLLPMPMNKQMATLYTRTMFQKFEQELIQSTACFLELKTEDACKVVFNVSERKNWETRVAEVVYVKDSDHASCSCKRFEFVGIICKHILALFRRDQIEYMPEKCILKRWKKTAKCGLVSDANGKEIKDCADPGLLIKRSTMSRLASDVVEDALMSEEGCEVLSATLKSLQVKLKLLKDGPSNNEVGGSSSQTQYMKDPKRVRCKGRSKGVTGAKEKAMKRGIRHCRECGHIGHDRRQCPALNTP
ncbi:hypothetical protein L3X38_020179 [Prunus dulcis]|uniref:Protein FAR1-RELATED SEQUENCE n=1 Tax=Prunus dulcis TaxID=3755 RepID=A0AAD4WCC8_PRUDU|nr:hypothetical protein L3X38_020179 [Prunus dulcis]